MKEDKIKIEIWMDIMCPFCYIGKRKLEGGLAQFIHKDKVELIWKSYLLDPNLKNDYTLNLNTYLALNKKVSVEQAAAMNRAAAMRAASVGLKYNLDKAIPVNTFKAHQFHHFAKKYNLQSEAIEVLFRSYFVDGKDVSDNMQLMSLAEDLDMNKEDLSVALEQESYVADVNADIMEAKDMGIKMVPYFLINDKHAISGTYDSNTFIAILNSLSVKY